jgi:Uma2 family endonuclease
MYAPVERRTWTVRDYYRMAETGILGPDERVELLNGEVVRMTPVGSRHAAAVSRLQDWLQRRLPEGMQLRVQQPVRLGEHSEPEPDLAVVRARDDFYAHAHPTGPDVLLVVEVAETSITYDKGVKRDAYARVGIPELWVVDLGHDRVVTYLEPSDGEYRRTQTHGTGASWHSPALGMDVRVRDVLGATA